MELAITRIHNLRICKCNRLHNRGTDVVEVNVSKGNDNFVIMCDTLKLHNFHMASKGI